MTECSKGTLLKFSPRLDVWTSTGDAESKRVTADLLSKLELKPLGVGDENSKMAAMKQAANVLRHILIGNGTIFPAGAIDKALHDLNVAISEDNQ